MNFQHYHNILQQIEKPTFVFDRFDNQEIMKLYIKQLEDYLTEKGADVSIKRKIFNITLEMLDSCYKTQHIDESNFVNFYDNHENYTIYSKILYANHEFLDIKNTLIKIKKSENYSELYLDLAFSKYIGFADIARKSHKNCYFNITTTEKDYFILEIIAVIHKVLV